MNRRASRIVLLITLLAFTPGHYARSADGKDASKDAHSWEALVYYRLPDGSHETVHLDNFRFVYYDRSFRKTASRIGGPKSLEIRDFPREVMSIQNENLDRLRFWKITSVRFEYRTEGSERRLYLVATLSSPRKKEPIAWPVDLLRNSNISQMPHFRGLQDGRVVEVLLPPLTEEATPEGRILTGIDFLFDGQTQRRSWL